MDQLDESIRNETQVLPTSGSELDSDAIRSGLDSPNYSPLLELVFQKWSSLILFRIMASPMRFNQLVRELAISPNTLAARLRDLERAGLIERVVESGLSPKPTYILTKSGLTFTAVTKHLLLWLESQEPQLVSVIDKGIVDINS